MYDALQSATFSGDVGQVQPRRLGGDLDALRLAAR